MIVKKTTLVLIICFFIFNAMSCKSQNTADNKNVVCGAKKMNAYTPYLHNKQIGIVANHSSMIGKTHLIDSLVSLQFDIKKIFSPEHGFRGLEAAGAKINNGIDEITRLPIVSLYGSKKKPSESDLADIEIMLFDIQDVGARFYTYISTLTYVMEACAENDILLIVLDRPNPNGHYVDGPVLNKKYSSFVGMHPIPIVHGLTIAEMALMIAGEGWLRTEEKCKLLYVSMDNYTHDTLYHLPIKPSPNLPNMKSVYLYPSLCLFEGTTVSVGRGTENPFQMIGHPNYNDTTFYFVPKKNKAATYPKHQDEICYGIDFSKNALADLAENREIDLSYLISMYEVLPDKSNFFNSFFIKLAGTEALQKQIENGLSEREIKESWQEDLYIFKKIRKKYLLYN